MDKLVLPYRYLKTDWGVIALLPKERGEGLPSTELSDDVSCDIFDDGMMGLVCGNALLPIPDDLLDFLISYPVLQVSMLGDAFVSTDHTLINIEISALYELRGLKRAFLKAEHQKAQ